MQQDIWYYAQTNQQQGPVTLQELRSLCSNGRLSPGDLAWTVGMEQWQPAGQIAALADAFVGPLAPPPPWPRSPAAESQFPASYPSELPQPLNYIAPHSVPAGFWMRVAAYLIDAIVLAAPQYMIFVAIPAITGAKLPEEPTPQQFLAYLPISCMTNLITLALGWFYFALMESSANQGTLGKMALGIKVTDMAGQRVTFGRASGRYFGKLLSTLTLGIGYIMAGWTQRKQALHDMLADTLVVRK